MSCCIEYVSGCLFVNGIWGTMASKGYFSCKFETCPFSLKMVTEKVDSQTVAVGVERILFGFHNHEKTEKSKTDSKREMTQKLESLTAFSSGEEALQFVRQLEKWEQEALSFSKAKRERLLDLEAVKIYALTHPEKTPEEVRDKCCVNVNTPRNCQHETGSKGRKR